MVTFLELLMNPIVFGYAVRLLASKLTVGLFPIKKPLLDLTE